MNFGRTGCRLARPWPIGRTAGRMAGRMVGRMVDPSCHTRDFELRQQQAVNFGQTRSYLRRGVSLAFGNLAPSICSTEYRMPFNTYRICWWIAFSGVVPIPSRARIGRSPAMSGLSPLIGDFLCEAGDSRHPRIRPVPGHYDTASVKEPNGHFWPQGMTHRSIRSRQ